MVLLGFLNKYNSFKQLTPWLRQYSEQIYILECIYPVNRKIKNIQIEMGKENRKESKNKSVRRK